MTEKWKKAVDNKKGFGAVLTDLLNTVHCIRHDLFIAEFHAYGLSFPALKLM